MAQGLSERSLADWQAFARSAGQDASKPLDRDRLNRFIVGVYQRREQFAAHELKMLIDELEVQPELARELVSFIEPAFGLLAAYAPQYDHDDDEGLDDDIEAGPGVLVI